MDIYSGKVDLKRLLKNNSNIELTYFLKSPIVYLTHNRRFLWKRLINLFRKVTL